MPQKNDPEKTEGSAAEPQGAHRTDPKQTDSHGPDRRAPYKPKFAPLWNNLITIVGMFVVAMAVMLLLTFGLFSVVVPRKNPYVDIVGFLVLPSILIFGLLIIPFGILLKSWRLHRRDPEQHLAFRFPRVDLNDPTQRRVAKIVLLCTFILLPLVGVSSYHGYHYTDSAAFCAKACHAAMHPQATTFENSAHARVACAECHIGSGASWFVKSKLSGTRQVLAMWQDSFPRPIPSAITDLRPARETCEHCHWPRKFFGAQLREIVSFGSDEKNSRRDIDMLLNTGGGDETTGRAEGIHKHMALEGQIKYIATDEKLQTIPWVEFVESSGKRLIYRSDGRPSSDPQPEGQERILDCMDCHNRPAHKFRSPQQAVDIYLDIGKIDTTLPFIKREATKALVREYPDLETAKTQIGVRLTEFYRLDYPDVWQARKASVNQAIDMVREIYGHNFFPDMNVDWRTYPDNIGHMNSPGCFRCHDGSHVNQYGVRLSHDCKICHTFLNRVDREGGGTTVQEGEFIHSYELQGPHADLRCDKCHDGGESPHPTCAGCHTKQVEFRAGTLAAFQAFEIDPDPMAEAVDCEGCHDLSGPTNVEAIDALCLDCHDDEPERYEGMLASWKEEVALLLQGAAAMADEPTGQLIQALREAGPLHNIGATRKILGAPTPSAAPPPSTAPQD